MDNEPSTAIQKSWYQRLSLLPALPALCFMVVVLLYCFWNSLWALGEHWSNPEYSHGYLVPVIAALLLWWRQENNRMASDADHNTLGGVGLVLGAILGVAVPIAIFYVSEYWDVSSGLVEKINSFFVFLGCSFAVIAAFLLIGGWEAFDFASAADRWWGVILLACGLGMRLVAAYFGTEVPELMSFVPALAGVFLLAGGWKLLVRAGPMILFLFFMLPLPWRVEQKVLVPLQKIATIGTTHILQMLGYGAYREGTTIHVGTLQWGVEDTCSGLRMTTVFLAVCCAVALVISRPLWEKIAIVASAIPIALLANMIRITATTMAHCHIGGKWVNQVSHDGAGWVMLPMGLVFLWVEVLILRNLIIEEKVASQALAPVRRRRHKRR